MRIALDAFGSDNAPFPEVEGAVQALNENLCEAIILVGKEDVLKAELAKYKYDTKRLEILHAPDVITMEDSSATAARRKKESSLVKALQLQKDGLVDAVVSAGNTGAVMAASLFTLGRIKNVLRPAIAVTIPTKKDPCVLMDVGANVDCESEHLLQFAQMGNLYSHYFFNVRYPKVGLLNIGEEDKKGNALARKTYPLLQQLHGINFAGNVEGKYLLDGEMDVVVTDGFVGNVVLKTLEGVASTIFSMLREQYTLSLRVKLGALLSKPVFRFIKQKMDHTEYGGALLMGLKGITIIAHGSSNAKSIKNALKVGDRIAKSGFVSHTIEFFEKQTDVPHDEENGKVSKLASILKRAKMLFEGK